MGDTTTSAQGGAATVDPRFEQRRALREAEIRERFEFVIELAQRLAAQPPSRRDWRSGGPAAR